VLNPIHPLLTNFVRLGAVNAFLAVALGAFGAHALKDVLSEKMLETYQTGSHYHLIHAIALLFVGLLGDRLASEIRAVRLVRLVGILFVAGIFLFAGSLYTLAITNIRVLGALTPFGGVCFLTGWALLVVALSLRPSTAVNASDAQNLPR
jgi:uncharacterized membrane protein YgdD (TMEM256/DUF423 family)